jgi:hypothetical protein
MAPRGTGGRARSGLRSKVAGPPPELLSIGVVDVSPPHAHAAHAAHEAPAALDVPHDAPVAIVEAPAETAKPRRGTRKRAGTAAAKAASADAPKARTAARKRPRKTASKVAPGSSET